MRKNIMKLAILLLLVIPVSIKAMDFFDYIPGYTTISDYLTDFGDSIDKYEAFVSKACTTTSDKALIAEELDGLDITPAEIDVLINYIYSKNEVICSNLGNAALHFFDIYYATHSYNNNLIAGSAFSPAYGSPDFQLENKINEDTVVDAFRHSRLTATVTGLMDDGWGLVLMNAHEENITITGNSVYAQYMDLHNNMVGYNVYHYLKDKYNGLEPSMEDVHNELLYRCYSYIEVDIDNLDESVIQDYKDKVDSTSGLVFIKKIGTTIPGIDAVEFEGKGVNCAVPKISEEFSNFDSTFYFPNSNPVTLDAYNSIASVDGSIKKYKWTFSRDVIFCSSSPTPCYKTRELESTSPDIFGYNRTYWVYVTFWIFSYWSERVEYLEGQVFLLDNDPIIVNLKISNQFDEYSQEDTGYINFSPEMVWLINFLNSLD